MPVETFGYIDSLNASNPVATDAQSQGDDHVRGIKATLKSQFPNLTAAMTATAAQLNQLATGVLDKLADGTSGAPAISFLSETTLGFYRSAAGIISFVGRLKGNGAVPVGSYHIFGVVPAGFGTEYLELDGATYANSAFPALAAHLGQGGTSFTLPNVTDTGRFIRSRKSGLAAGTTQSNVIKSHTAALNGTAASHVHTAADHTHSNGMAANRDGRIVEDAGGGNFASRAVTTTGGNIWYGAPTDTGTVNGGTLATSASGALALTGTADYSGDTETRPEAIAGIFCIKT
jgi:hypothetical protein